MIRLRPMPAGTFPAAAALLIAIVCAAPANAQSNAQSLIGKWSADQACGVTARQIVFRGTTMELWDASQRIFSGSVRFQSSGNETAVTVVNVSRETPPQPGSPEVGDVATFRRDGTRLYGVAVTRRGERRAAPDGTPPFYLCR